MVEVKTTSTGELTFEKPEGAGEKDFDNDLLTNSDTLADVAGGMGRHLGVFSCTMLMYVFSYPIPVHYYHPYHMMPVLVK